MAGPREGQHRALLALSAIYHVAAGLAAACAPETVLALFALDPARFADPLRWTGLALTGYGALCAYAAIRPERAHAVAALGAVAKTCELAAWAVAAALGVIPPRSFGLTVFDAYAWLLPLALIALEGTRVGARLRASAPYACAVVNGAAALALATVLAPGTTLVGDPAARAAYVRGHLFEWRVGWGLWLLATTTLTAFYFWWAARLRPSPIVAAAVALTLPGYASDLAAQSLMIGWVPDRPELMTLASALTGGATNVLYTIAGIALSLRTRVIRGALVPWTAVMWLAGVGVSAFLLLDVPLAIEASSAVLYVLFVPWCVVVGRRLAAAG